MITEMADKIFEIWNSNFSYQLYASGIIACILATFIRLKGNKWKQW